MKKLSVIAIVAAGLTLAGGGRWAAAMSQFDWGSAASMGFEERQRERLAACLFPDHRRRPAPRRHGKPGQVRLRRGQRVEDCLTQDFDVYNWAPLGWSGGCGPTGLNYRAGPSNIERHWHCQVGQR